MTHNCACSEKGGHFSTVVTGKLERPRYAPGLILEDSDLTLAVEYTRSLNQLLFRSLFGCGVVCGLTVTVNDDCDLAVTVAPGLGIDGCGDPIHLTAPATLKLDRTDRVVARKQDGVVQPPEIKDFWLIACAGEKQCAPRALVCDADDLDGTRQATRTRATVEVSVSFDEPDCACGCDPKTVRRDRPSEKDYDDRARRLLDPAAYDAPASNCQVEHEKRIGCADDCGCGSACSCGCCVVLAWVHWFVANGEEPGGWGVIHSAVRRVIRPSLVQVDPMADSDRQASHRWLGDGAPVMFGDAQKKVGKPAKPAAVK